MADLQEEHKLLIIELLATGHSSAETMDAFADIYPQQKLTPQQISSYKPGTMAGNRMSEEHKQYYWETRERFLSDRSAILITHETYRLAKLQRILDSKQAKNPEIVLKTIKLYEEIKGGVYNRKKEEGGIAEGLKTLRHFLGVQDPKPAESGSGE